MSIEEKEEWKQINDLAIQAGKAFQSAQTGLIHYCLHASPEEVQHTIPVYENLLYSLALMRSRTGDAITEGKGILERMLSFQNNEGSFPVHIHEFPYGRDRFIGAYLLPPLYWILVQFHTVLGIETKNKLEAAARALLVYTLKTQASFDIPPHLIARIGGASVAFGKHWNDVPLIAHGEQLLDSLPKDQYALAWSSPQHIADLLTALQLVYPTLQGTSWEPLMQDLGHAWHAHLAAPLNPVLKELQSGFQPQLTMYDLWMGYLTKVFPKRLQNKFPFLLQGALIHSTSDHISKVSYPIKSEGVVNDEHYLLKAFDKYAYSAYQSKQPLHPAADRGRHPFRLIWGDTNHCHTLVAEGGNVTSWDYNEIQQGIELIATLSTPVGDDDREKNREVILYCDLHNDLKFSVSGSPSSIFRLGETVEIESGDLKAVISFELMEGEGDFIGHLMRGNRHSQVSDKGVHKFTAFDQQIVLRTLRRSHPCKVKIRILIN